MSVFRITKPYVNVSKRARMKKRRKRGQTECHMTYGIPSSPQTAERSNSGWCIRMCKKVFLNRFGMKVKPTATTAASLERGNNSNNKQQHLLQKATPAIATQTTTTAIATTTAATTAASLENRPAQHLHFDSLQSGISAETITIALGSNSITNIEPTKIDTTFKLMRTPPHEMLMWQVVTGAFGSLLRYAQESINVFFCPM